MFKLLNPYFFKKYSMIFLPFLFVVMFGVLGLALYQALISSPVDYQQGEMVRIMYVHVPSAWMSLGIYSFMALCSFVNLVWRISLAYLFAIAAAPIGAIFALITLVTGSIWGKPIWGTWWVWDARLTSMLVLFLFYLSYIAVINSGDDIRRAEKPASVVALIGFINVPIVKFSVNLWYSLHQPASIIKMGGPAIDKSMLIPLILMFVVFIIYFLIIMILNTNRLIISFNGEYNQ